MKAKPCSSKGDTDWETLEWPYWVLSWASSLIDQFIQVTKYSTQLHNISLFFLAHWCLQPLGLLAWLWMPLLKACISAHTHAHIASSFFLFIFYFFFYEAFKSEDAAWDLQRTVGNMWDQRKVLIQQVLLRLQ